MDPNPKKFPLLSFVLTRINSIGKPKTKADQSDVDLEQQPSSDEVELITRMPHLNHPEFFSSMAGAIADVAQTRSILSALGSRPDHESIDLARSRIAELEASEKESELEASEKESELSEKSDVRKSELQGLRALVQLDDMHEAYQTLLKEAEERLVGIYGEKMEERENASMHEGKEESGGDEVGLNQEVVRVLKDAREGKSVQEVDLSGQNLIILPEEFGRVSTLRLLNLSSNQLKMIPDSIAGLEHLEELRLAKNLLRDLPDSIGMLTNLKILDVSGNKLTRLPDSISHCRSLVELNASYNDLEYLPTNIGLKLSYLQTLMIYLNKLRYLPTSICEMRSLRHLDAHFNELHGLPPNFGKLTNLEILNLSSNFNDMTELPQSFGDLMNLKQLDLSNNQIHILPDSFGFLRNLVKLNLDQNPLVIPPADVVDKGANAVVEFMDNRMVEMIEKEEQERLERGEEEEEADDGESSANASWLTRSTSVVSGWISGVSDYLGTGQRSPRDPYLEEPR